ncbi:hypothetical protein RHSP_75525 [Rhizobium freirei PRF 81]|uniref:DUF3885 domain-containing protein n=1 Tax=Rhizobium freirei PRF 81 TaxID=363754 RepID=N6U758_9HYPH|nr:hypothetical protein [Rhizobium freirei]ENN88424.1 hypothetical protein RHSP_75525 [Rhizobium freirei PRF 81]
MPIHAGIVQSQGRPKEERYFDAIGSSLFGAKDLLVSVFVPVIKFNGESGRYRYSSMTSVGSKLVESDIIDEEEEEGVTFGLYGSVEKFSSLKIEQMVLKIMRDEIMQAVMISREGNVIAPYEGGFDVFSDRIGEVDRLRGLFPAWLSDGSDGL